MADPADNIQTYRQILKLDRRSRVFALLAEELCVAGEWKEAVEVCKKGLLFHPDHLRSRVLLGWALMEMGEADQSERILLSAVEDFRKNSMIFKLLSEFARFSGNAENAGEYARIYEAFQTPVPARGEISSPPEPDHIEPVFPLKEETSEPDSLKSEVVEELHGPDIERASQEISAQLTPELELKPKFGLEDILVHLAQRIEERLAKEAPPAAILSDEDKNLLKQKIVAVLSG